MIEPLPLYPEGKIPFDEPPFEMTPTIQPFPLEGARGAVVVFPGGGYFQRSDLSEGERVAEAYNRAGFAAFVLRYRYRPYDGRAILADGQRAVRYARAYAQTYGYSPDKIAVCGFSAGGHLAIITCEQDAPAYCGDEIDACSARANALVLCYPVTTFKWDSYPPMPRIFLREKKDDEALLAQYSFDYRIDALPPTYVWYSKKDDAVLPEKNSIPLTVALKAAGTDVLCDAFSDGAHGIGLAHDFAECGTWHARSVSFLRKHEF